jgi:YD repeat-containing protein
MYDQTLLRRTAADSYMYEMTWPDGSRKIFSQPNGSVGANRRVYLTEIVDPAGNALTFTYDENLRLVAVTDAIGQVTTLTYGDGTRLPNTLLTRVADPFGRSAKFKYEKRVVRIVTHFILTLVNPGSGLFQPRISCADQYDRLGAQ